MEDAHCGSGHCFLTLIDYMHGVKQLISTFLMQLNAPSVHDFLCWLLLYQTVTGSIEHLWALAFRKQVRESVTKSLRSCTHRSGFRLDTVD